MPVCLLPAVNGNLKKALHGMCMPRLAWKSKYFYNIRKMVLIRKRLPCIFLLLLIFCCSALLLVIIRKIVFLKPTRNGFKIFLSMYKLFLTSEVIAQNTAMKMMAAFFY